MRKCIKEEAFRKEGLVLCQEKVQIKRELFS